MRNRFITIGIVVTGAAVLIVFGALRVSSHNLQLKAYFDDAMGLKPGAPVRIAGVDVGRVTAVVPHPELREKPAEVGIEIRDFRQLRIPRDSVASLATAGVLGETFVNIDARAASGPPIESGGTLQTQHSVTLNIHELIDQLAGKMELSTSELLQKLEAAAAQRPCSPAESEQSSKQAHKSKPRQ